MSGKQGWDVARRKRFIWPCTFARTGSCWTTARAAGRHSVWDPGLQVCSDYWWLPNELGFFLRFAPTWPGYGRPDSVSRRVCTRNFSHPVERSEQLGEFSGIVVPSPHNFRNAGCTGLNPLTAPFRAADAPMRQKPK